MAEGSRNRFYMKWQCVPVSELSLSRTDVMCRGCVGRGVSPSPPLVCHFPWENVQCPGGEQEIYLQKLRYVQCLLDFVGQTVTKKALAVSQN